MKPRRSNPLYSPFGCGSAVVLVLFLSFMLLTTGPSLFSPGKLSAFSSGAPMDQGATSHAEFEENCQLCHGAWIGVEPSRCLDCHDEIDTERESGTGIHGRLSDSGRCTTCHTDHNGIESKMTTFDLNGFQHGSLTGFSLVHHQTDYGNSPILCSDCHPPGRYLLATVDCVDCHEDNSFKFIESHTSLFGSACLDCHDGLDSMSTFDHSRIFILEGAHENLQCEACHDQSVVSDEARSCVECHGEPQLHIGQFGTDCVRCHSTSAWTPAQLSQHVFLLDHGGSGKVECQVCHEASYAEYTCYGCHEHERQDVIEEHLDEGLSDINECAECHPTGQEDEAQSFSGALTLSSNRGKVKQR